MSDELLSGGRLDRSWVQGRQQGADLGLVVVLNGHGVSTGSSCRCPLVRNLARARWVVLFTVPTAIPSSWAVSASLRSTRKRNTTTRRSRSVSSDNAATAAARSVTTPNASA